MNTGDVVRILRGRSSLIGKEGTIINIDGGWYAVQFKGMTTLHNGYGISHYDDIWFFKREDFEVVEIKEKKKKKQGYLFNDL